MSTSLAYHTQGIVGFQHQRANFKSLDDCFEMFFGISFRGVFGSYFCGQLPQTTGNDLLKEFFQIISPNTFEITSLEKKLLNNLVESCENP